MGPASLEYRRAQAKHPSWASHLLCLTLLQTLHGRRASTVAQEVAAELVRPRHSAAFDVGLLACVQSASQEWGSTLSLGWMLCACRTGL